MNSSSISQSDDSVEGLGIELVGDGARLVANVAGVVPLTFASLMAYYPVSRLRAVP